MMDVEKRCSAFFRQREVENATCRIADCDEKRLREVFKAELSHFAAAVLRPIARDVRSRITKIAMNRDRAVLVQIAEDIDILASRYEKGTGPC